MSCYLNEVRGVHVPSAQWLPQAVIEQLWLEHGLAEVRAQALQARGGRLSLAAEVRGGGLTVETFSAMLRANDSLAMPRLELPSGRLLQEARASLRAPLMDVVASARVALRLESATGGVSDSMANTLRRAAERVVTLDAVASASDRAIERAGFTESRLVLRDEGRVRLFGVDRQSQRALAIDVAIGAAGPTVESEIVGVRPSERSLLLEGFTTSLMREGLELGRREPMESSGGHPDSRGTRIARALLGYDEIETAVNAVGASSGNGMAEARRRLDMRELSRQWTH